MGAAHFSGNSENLVERIQEGHLQQHGQAAAHRIDAVLLVQLHHFLVLVGLLGVLHRKTLVFFVNRLDLRLQRRHFLRRLHAGNLQREEQKVDDQRDQHNRPSVVVRHVIGGPVDSDEQRLGDDTEPAPVDNLLQLGVHLAEQVRIFGTDEQREAVQAIAAHSHADALLILAIGIRNGVRVSHLIDGGFVTRQKRRREITVFDAGKRKLAAGRNRAVLGVTVGKRLQLGVRQVVVNGVLNRGGIAHGGVAKSASPREQVRKRRAVLRDFRGYANQIAGRLKVESLFAEDAPVGKFKIHIHA